MLQAGDRVPQFKAARLDGSRLNYGDIWQQKNLLLVSLPEAGSADSATYVSQLRARMAERTAHDTECLITTDLIGGRPRPGVIIADRWSEIHLVAHGASAADLPQPNELIDWLRYIQSQCPECQGETR